MLIKSERFLMVNYYNVSPITGVVTGILGYDLGDDYIIIYFRRGKHTTYTYTNSSCGALHITAMKQLANAQSGLNTYLTDNKPPYASKS